MERMIVVPRAGLEPARPERTVDFKSTASTNSATPAHGQKNGGDARDRTGDKGFAGPCLTTWPRRLE